MATNYSTILNNVCILSKETQPSTFASTAEPYPELKKYIVDVLGDICQTHDWTFLERSYDLSTVSGTREYSLPGDLELKNILADGVRRASWTPPLYYVQDSILDQTVLTSGAPIRYSVFNNQLILDPTPDAAYTITIKYRTNYYAYAVTSVDADSASAQAQLNIAATTGAEANGYVLIGSGTARREEGRISSFNASNYLTLSSNLAYTHTLAQADPVYISRDTLSDSTDITLIPDRFIKAIEYGAAAAYRGNFRPDEKYAILERKYQDYLKDLRASDGFGDDAYPSLVVGRNNKSANRMLIDSFRQAGR